MKTSSITDWEHGNEIYHKKLISLVYSCGFLQPEVLKCMVCIAISRGVPIGLANIYRPPMCSYLLYWQLV